MLKCNLQKAELEILWSGGNIISHGGQDIRCRLDHEGYEYNACRQLGTRTVQMSALGDHPDTNGRQRALYTSIPLSIIAG